MIEEMELQGMTYDIEDYRIRGVMSEDGLSDLTEMERLVIINKRITAQLDDMTSSDIMEAYADNLFDWYETWSDDELRELK
jgi:hypothetical protein